MKWEFKQFTTKNSSKYKRRQLWRKGESKEYKTYQKTPAKWHKSYFISYYSSVNG